MEEKKFFDFEKRATVHTKVIFVLSLISLALTIANLAGIDPILSLISLALIIANLMD